MTFTEMKIKGAWVHTPTVWPDERGTFHEVFKLSQIEQQLGRTFTVKQVNQSVSAKGVIRGIHWVQGSASQDKFVTCTSGSVWDIVVDPQRHSPTFGQWEAVELSASNRHGLLISGGLAHGFLSLEESSTVNYLCSQEYDPSSERSFSPFDPLLEIPFSEVSKLRGISRFILSPKDANSMSFEESTT